MRYTITALTTNPRTVEVMRNNLLAVGAKRDDITIKLGEPGTSQHHLSIKTDDLKAAEAYRDMLELAGGTSISTSEESSVFNAIKDKRL